MKMKSYYTIVLGDYPWAWGIEIYLSKKNIQTSVIFFRQKKSLNKKKFMVFGKKNLIGQ